MTIYLSMRFLPAWVEGMPSLSWEVFTVVEERQEGRVLKVRAQAAACHFICPVPSPVLFSVPSRSHAAATTRHTERPLRPCPGMW